MDLSLSHTVTPESPISLEIEKPEQKKAWPRKLSSILKWKGGKDEHTTSCLTTPKKDHAAVVRPSRKVIPENPRQGTFRRQNSERRDNLKPAQPAEGERRAASVGRKRAMSARPASPKPACPMKMSAPAVCHNDNAWVGGDKTSSMGNPEQTKPPQRPFPPPSPPPEHEKNENLDGGREPKMPQQPPFDAQKVVEDIRHELESRWILNLSMHFRDNSPREKFFVTYAETSTRWRRVTISCDYRETQPDSLERDLQGLQYQRDKSARIYEAIRLSLPDIQFYDTVTNLKLETTPDDRLHIHVTEDVNEIIPYPEVDLVQHIETRFVPESEVHFVTHMSGFVYKVKVGDKIYVKKEVPGPESVDEFLYEINALNSLNGSSNVIQFQGLVFNPETNLLTGLLIDYAEHGSLVDMIFDADHTIPYSRRERWMRQIIQGLSDIHEAGFVQGDFTLSNIVIDSDDNARIIDINRRGCPLGWEPPEIATLIESRQRISMYIGVKSDLYQLGMVLWALVEEEDEPERSRPLRSDSKRFLAAPDWLVDVVEGCLATNPCERPAARRLLKTFPRLDHGTTDLEQTSLERVSRCGPGSSLHSEKKYIDPSQAVEREDLGEKVYGNRGTFSSNSHKYVMDQQPRRLSAGMDYSSDDDEPLPSVFISKLNARRGYSSGIASHRQKLHQPRRGRTLNRSRSTGSSHISPGRSSEADAHHENVSHYDRDNEDDDDHDDERYILSPQVIPISPSRPFPYNELELEDGTRGLVLKDGYELTDSSDDEQGGSERQAAETDDPRERASTRRKLIAIPHFKRDSNNPAQLASHEQVGSEAHTETGGERSKSRSTNRITAEAPNTTSHCEVQPVYRNRGARSSPQNQPYQQQRSHHTAAHSYQFHDQYSTPSYHNEPLSFQHVDSGLADMELELSGVGGNEHLQYRDECLDGLDEEERERKRGAEGLGVIEEVVSR
ncbi:hypothetical protein MMC25_006786 [Agyrium rufum]|nr:hypothetical protein [Agyrium rufum]